MKKVLLVILISFFSIYGLHADFNSRFESDFEDEMEEDEEDEEESVREEDEEEESEEAEEEEEEESESEEDDFAPKDKKDDFAPSKPAENDPFVNKPSSEDAFSQDTVQKDAFSSSEDDFVLEKRQSDETYQYKKPDLGKVVIPTYLYAESDIKSKKLFELYSKDEVEIMEENNGFFRVKFLGKEGWIPMADVQLEKWHTYRVSMEIAGGAGSGGGDIKNFDVLGNYSFRLNVSVVQDFVVGLEGRALSFDVDSFYVGGGLMLRYYIHGLRSKKTRSALTVAGGYLAGQEKPGSTYEFQMGETQYKVFSGPYIYTSLDYFVRMFEYMNIGFGGYFSYVHLFGSTENAKLEKGFYQGGGQLSLTFNILR